MPREPGARPWWRWYHWRRVDDWPPQGHARSGHGPDGLRPDRRNVGGRGGWGCDRERRLDASYELQTGPVDPAVERAAIVDLSKVATAFGGGRAVWAGTGGIPPPSKTR